MNDNSGAVLRHKAFHPHWVGHLVFRADLHEVCHEETRQRGSYALSGDRIDVQWRRFAPESFIRIGDAVFHEELVSSAVDLNSLTVGALGNQRVLVEEVRVQASGLLGPIFLRPGTDDAAVYRQIVVELDYGASWFPDQVSTIVDLGANIGLASLFLAKRYPNAQIYAVEPEPANFDLLQRNVAALGERMRCRKAAAAALDGVQWFTSVDERGRDLGAWGGRLATGEGPVGYPVECVGMETVFREAGFEQVDLLKVDIEGGEVEVFTNPSGWLDRVKFICIETHERFRAGSDRAVRTALEEAFEELPMSGENLLFRRRELGTQAVR